MWFWSSILKSRCNLLDKSLLFELSYSAINLTTKSASSFIVTMSSTPFTPGRTLRSTPARQAREFLDTPRLNEQTPSGRLQNTPARVRRSLPQIDETPAPSRRRRRSSSIVALEEQPARRRRIQEAASEVQPVKKTTSRIWSYFSEASVDSRGKVDAFPHSG
jgi:hypothetical protein